MPVWKLFALALTFTDAGVTTSFMPPVDFAHERACTDTAKALTGKIERMHKGRPVTVETQAKCRADALPVREIEIDTRAPMEPPPDLYRRRPFTPPVVVDIAPPYPGGTLARPYDRPMPIAPIEPHAGPEPWPQ